MPQHYKEPRPGERRFYLFEKEDEGGEEHQKIGNFHRIPDFRLRAEYREKRQKPEHELRREDLVQQQEEEEDKQVRV